MKQTIVRGAVRCPEILRELGVKKPLLVCGASIDKLEPVREILFGSGVEWVRFSDFSPNPEYEEARRGVGVFQEKGCDGLFAVGGGSAIDVAKCVKAWSRTELTDAFPGGEAEDTGVPFIALPTTAGSGSESTKNAVIYYHSEKQGVRHESLIPDYAVLEPSVLETLPLYQKKCTMLDALCQAIESWWSVSSTPESIALSKAAVDGILAHYRAYLAEKDGGAAAEIMAASNLAGQAINITATTAPHAMSYQLTKRFGIPHGHAVALGMPEVWEYLEENTDLCRDARGADYFQKTLAEISEKITPARFRALLRELEIGPVSSSEAEKDIAFLAGSVNAERLQNNPVALDNAVLRGFYEKIVGRKA